VRIVERSDTRLVLGMRPAGARLFSSVFFGAAVLLFIFLGGARGDWFVLRLLLGLVAIGTSWGALMLFAMSAPRATVDLDKQRGSVIIARRRIKPLPDEEHPLSAIAGVDVETSEEVDSADAYRLVFKMADGSSVAPVQVSPESRERLQLLAVAVREFLQ
jgi:hypothetical protein